MCHKNVIIKSSLRVPLSHREDVVILPKPALDRFPHFADLLDDARLDALVAPLYYDITVTKVSGLHPFGETRLIR
jgi:hypothetical protein